MYSKSFNERAGKCSVIKSDRPVTAERKPSSTVSSLCKIVLALSLWIQRVQRNPQQSSLIRESKHQSYIPVLSVLNQMILSSYQPLHTTLNFLKEGAVRLSKHEMPFSDLEDQLDDGDRRDSLVSEDLDGPTERPELHSEKAKVQTVPMGKYCSTGSSESVLNTVSPCKQVTRR